LRESLPPQCIINNPLDLTGDTDAERYRMAAVKGSECKVGDIFFLIFGDPIPGASEVVLRLKYEIPQPIVVSYLGGGEVGRLESLRLMEKGIAVFPTPERAMKAISYLMKI
jgi:acyl-CoA synthetase (NDP forming)